MNADHRRKSFIVGALILAQTAGWQNDGTAVSSVNKGEWRRIRGPERYYHTATVLTSGKVLVAGGCKKIREQPPGPGLSEGCEAASTAELYDPESQKWTSAGQFLRLYHTATLLPDGKVLFAGGCLPGSCLAGDDYAKIYDAKTQTWSNTGPPVEFFRHNWPRHTATLLPTGPGSICGDNCGRVLVVGPFAAQLFDPATGNWSAAGNDPQGLHLAPGIAGDKVFGIHHTASSLATGQVFIHGGVSALYNPLSREWLPTVTSPIQKRFHTATSLPDGKILVAGGLMQQVEGSRRFYVGSAAAELYDPSTSSTTNGSVVKGAFTPTGDLQMGRGAHATVLLKNGQVLAAGGGNAGNDLKTNRLSTAEIYNPGTAAWNTARRMPVGRGGIMPVLPAPPTFTLTLLPDGSVLAVGGAPSASSDIFYPPGSPPAAAPSSMPARLDPLVKALAAGLVAGVLLFILWRSSKAFSPNKQRREDHNDNLVSVNP